MGRCSGTPWFLLRTAPLVLCLCGLSGCGTVDGIKTTLRSVSGTMVMITDLATRLEGTPRVDYVYQLEDRVFAACKNLLDVAHYRIQREEIPLSTQFRVVFTVDQCQKIVDEVQPELETLNDQVFEPSGAGIDR